MNDGRYNELREQSWFRELTEAEQAELHAFLNAHPEARADWETDAALTAAVDRLPDAPVPSNFTARVLRSVEREMDRSARRQSRAWGWWRRFLPRVAVTAVLMGVGVVSFQQYRISTRADLAKGLAVISSEVQVPEVEWLHDFEPIRLLSHTPPPDEELLTLLQ